MNTSLKTENTARATASAIAKYKAVRHALAANMATQKKRIDDVYPGFADYQNIKKFTDAQRAHMDEMCADLYTEAHALLSMKDELRSEAAKAALDFVKSLVPAGQRHRCGCFETILQAHHMYGPDRVIAWAEAGFEGPIPSMMDVIDAHIEEDKAIEARVFAEVTA